VVGKTPERLSHLIGDTGQGAIDGGVEFFGKSLPESFYRRTELVKSAQSVTRRLQRPNLTYRFYRVRTPFSDHVTMVRLDGEDREGFCVSIGSACRENRDASWRKAVLEAVQGRHYVRYLKSEAETARMPVTFADHAVFYSRRPELLPDTVLERAEAPPPTRDTCARPDRARVEISLQHPSFSTAHGCEA